MVTDDKATAMPQDPVSQPRGSRERRLGLQAWRLVLILAWSLWWGGLTFYATVVVPLATDELGSVTQGFVTRRVTAWHNGGTAVVLFLFAIEAYVRRGKLLAGVVVVLAFDLVALLLTHGHLTGLMDFATRTVPEGFYHQHATYLWLTTVEWCAGGVLLLWLRPVPPE